LISGLRYLRGLQHLRLRFYSQPLNDLEAVRGITSLVDLDAIVGDELNDLSPLASLKRLKRLDLTNCPAVSDLALRKNDQTPKWQMLAIFSCWVSCWPCYSWSA
jgi:hypothetical protein